MMTTNTPATLEAVEEQKKCNEYASRDAELVAAVAMAFSSGVQVGEARATTADA